MTLRYGADTPDAIYLGADRVDRIYLGETQVWPDAVTPPPGRADGLMERTFSILVQDGGSNFIGWRSHLGSNQGGSSISPDPINLVIVAFLWHNGRLRVVSEPGIWTVANPPMLKVKWGSLPEATMEIFRDGDSRSPLNTVAQADRAGYIGQTVDVTIATDRANIIAI